MKKIIFLIQILLGVSIHFQGQSFQSRHFTIQKLADGVYAAISNNGGYAICNAGIIDMGDYTVVIDPFMTPEAARDLRKVSQFLTGHPVKYVVNSHFHNDHIGGNQEFEGAVVISTERTRELVEKYQPEEMADGKIAAPKQLEKLKKQDITVMTAHEQDENTMWTGYYQALVSSLDSLHTILPSVTFNNSLTLYGTSRKIELLSYGSGHTESDLFLFLPGEKIAFLGDLLFINNQPWLGDGDPVKWQSYLDSIARLDITKVIPGHGPAGSLENFKEMKSYFESVKNAAISYHEKGILPTNNSIIKSPFPFDGWFLSGFYRPNVISEYNRLYKN
jgi:glyoxylase-like metal-dependent hydrolase (beta-lactamase superfamily II)